MGTWPSVAQTSGRVRFWWCRARFLILGEREENRLTFPVCALGAQDFEDVDAAAAVGGLQNNCVASH
jgi:hypothetical protein